MKKIYTSLTALFVAWFFFASCEGQLIEPDQPDGDQPNVEQPGDTDPGEGGTGGGTGIPQEDVVPDPASGISVTPVKPDADGSCTITLTALETNEFMDYTGDVYMHIGIIIDDEWKFVESNWDVNHDKFKMTFDGEKSWSLDIPNVREFFTLAEPTTPIVKIGMVARSAAEVELVNDKGEKYSAKLQTRPDQFVSLTDNRNAYVPFQPDAVVEQTMPQGLKYGINYTGSNEVTLVFYEKDKNRTRYDYCYVVGDFNNWERKSAYAMKRDEAAGCWWTTVTVDDPSKEYRFQYRMARGDSEIRVQDPYSEIYYHGDDHWILSSTYPDLPAYPEGGRGFVSAFQIEKPAYAWKHDDFKIKDEDDLVIYELLLRDFTSSGDLNGAMTKLDYLVDLGVTAIELMPIQEFEGNDSWGYAPVGYFALDKAYGTREMYKAFIDECHSRGLAVIVDVVYNHTTGSHPWARLYWNGSDNVSQNNPWYNVVAPHGFGLYQDLDHANEMVKDHINRSLVYLIEEYHIDGFRFDLTKGFTNNSGKDSAYDQSRVDYLKGYYNTIKKADPDAVVILEHFVEDENYELGNSGMKVWRNLNNAYCQAAMGYSSESDFGGLEDINYQWAAFGTYVGFMESHDEERMGYKQKIYGTFGDGAASAEGSWGLIGLGNDWTNDLQMSYENGIYFADNVSFSSSDYFKFRKDGNWDLNYGLTPKGTKVKLDGANVLVSNGDGGEDMTIAAGVYDVYFLPVPGVAWFLYDGQKPAPFWGVVGSHNDWGNSGIPDVALTAAEDGFFVSQSSVSFTAGNLFKIRGNNAWDDRCNYGASKQGGETIAVNKAYTMTLGASSQNMSVPAGTYDIWFKPSNGTIWIMTPGQKPAEAGGDADTGLPEDNHTIAMRRLGLNAAFFLTVPGPKMIWQFGEIGYDVSIEDGGRTGRKPVLTDEYMSDPARKALYATYAELLKFRKENPRFFDSDARFRWYVSESEWPGRYLFNAVDGKNIAIFGNFGKGSQQISVELPHGGTWYNYFKKDETWTGANHTPTLKEGEFVFLVDWK